MESIDYLDIQTLVYIKYIYLPFLPVHVFFSSQSFLILSIPYKSAPVNIGMDLYCTNWHTSIRTHIGVILSASFLSHPFLYYIRMGCNSCSDIQQRLPSVLVESVLLATLISRLKNYGFLIHLCTFSWVGWAVGFLFPV